MSVQNTIRNAWRTINCANTSTEKLSANRLQLLKLKINKYVENGNRMVCLQNMEIF
uniref:Uncharacterized protein n=1 Tax=Anguilla anguilla TaxID=7936 RepID=A0A0E9QZL5_ANGAN